MKNLSLIALTTSFFAASPLAAQPVEPSANDVPSAATIAGCTQQIATRWTQMTPAEQKRQTQAAMITTCAINTDLATYAGEQNSDMIAARKARIDEIAAQNAKYIAERADWAAKVQQQKDDYAAVFAQWEADVAACEAGDMSKCASQ